MFFLHLSAAFSAITFSTAVAQSAEPRLLSSCSHCWPLSGVYANSLMAPDGAGGTYVVWVDGSFRWRLQRLGADLSVPEPWPSSGLGLTTERQSSRIYPVLAADGSGGVYVAWAEQATNGDMSAWLLRVRADGRPARGWPNGGVALTGPSPMVTYPALVRSGKGAAVGWVEARNGKALIRLAARDANGRPLAGWPADGVSLQACECSLGDAVLLASDGRAGLFLGWMEMREVLSDLQVAYVSGLGAARTWTLVSRALPPDAIQLESHPEMVADGLGGAIALWADQRGQARVGKDLVDAFAQRMTPTGQDLWTPAAPGHHPIAAGPGYQMNPHVVSDGKGGAYFAWNEHGPFAETSGRAQHLDAQGRAASGWPAGGIALGLEVAGLASDLDDGALAMWTDSSGAHLQRIGSRWSPESGAPASLSLGAPAGRSNVRMASDGRGGAFMAWEERGGVVSPGLGGSSAEGARLKVLIQHLNLESGVASPIVQLPIDQPGIAFAVHPIAPNPAHGPCLLRFDLPAPGPVTIDVFDVAGRRIARLADRQPFGVGSQSVTWDLSDRRGRRVPAGLYLVRVSAGRNQAVVRITVLG